MSQQLVYHAHNAHAITDEVCLLSFWATWVDGDWSAAIMRGRNGLLEPVKTLCWRELACYHRTLNLELVSHIRLENIGKKDLLCWWWSLIGKEHLEWRGRDCPEWQTLHFQILNSYPRHWNWPLVQKFQCQFSYLIGLRAMNCFVPRQFSTGGSETSEWFKGHRSHFNKTLNSLQK